jgi:hypothetical protein
VSPPSSLFPFFFFLVLTKHIFNYGFSLTLLGPPNKRPASFEALYAERDAYRSVKRAKANWTRRGGSLIYDPAKFNHFPQHDAADFRKIRCNPSLVYFDRTKYILNIENIRAEALLFLRPRRFGKSLIVSMMDYFHGIQYRDDYAMLFEVR